MQEGFSLTTSLRRIKKRRQVMLFEYNTRVEMAATTDARLNEAAYRYGVAAGEVAVCKVIEDDAGVNLRVDGNWTPPWEVRHDDEK